MSALKVFDKEVGPILQFTITGIDSLAAATVLLLVDDGSSLACTVPDPTQRVAQYTKVAGDLDPGTFKGQLKITQGLNIFYSDTFDIEVGKALA